MIDDFQLVFRHSDGETRLFRWSGLNETFSEIRDTAGNRQVVSRDQIPIALKIGTESLIEKLVRFQEPRYNEGVRPSYLNLLAHFSFLKHANNEDYVTKVLDSKELHQMLEARRSSFWWKVGRYEVTIQPSSPRKFTLLHPRFSFELSNIDVGRLQTTSNF